MAANQSWAHDPAWLDAAKEAMAERIAPGGAFEVQRIKVNGVWVHGFTALKQADTVGAFYDRELKLHPPDHIAYVSDSGSEMTFEALRQMLYALAAAFVKELQVGKGDRVTVGSRNCPEWCVTFLATITAGGVAIPLNAWWKTEEIRYGLSDSGSKVLVCDAERLQRASPVLSDLGVAAVLMPGEATQVTLRPPARMELFDELVRRGAAIADAWTQPGGVRLDDDAIIMYTSGTTGHPKGVVQTHRNVLTQLTVIRLHTESRAAAMERLYGLMPLPEQQVSSICTVPLFHVTASHHLFLGPLSNGHKIIFMRKWDATRALQLVEAHKISYWVGVPTMVQDLIEHPDFEKYDTSSLGLIGSGGAAMPPPTATKMSRRWPGSLPYGSWGMTELNGGATTIWGADFLARPAACGKDGMVPVTELRVVDEETAELIPNGSGRSGELVVRSSLLMRGYWNKPEATAKLMLSLPGDDDDRPGWMRTGDVAVIDGDGFLQLLDRKKDIIIRGGENISCTEIENALYEHPAVMECAAFGLPDARLGEEVGVLVMLKRDHLSTTAMELRASVQGRLAAFKIPAASAIFLTDKELPRGDTGKILKRQIRDTYSARSKL